MSLELKKFLVGIMVSSFLVSPLAVLADDDDDEEDDDTEIAFDVSRLFFELNDTDGDLGIHGEVDGEPWKFLKISNQHDRTLLKIRAKGNVRRQGMTELFFESAEPPFEDLSPAEFFARFPSGEYEIEALTTTGEEMEAEVMLSHVMPAPVADVSLNGIVAAEDCDAPELPIVSLPVTIEWGAVTSSHPDIGEEGPVTVEYYEVVAEIDDMPYQTSTILPEDVTSFTFPDELVSLSDEVKFEILVRHTNGNKTAVESCFEVE